MEVLNHIELAYLSELEFSVKKFKFCPKCFISFQLRTLSRSFQNLMLMASQNAF